MGVRLVRKCAAGGRDWAKCSRARDGGRGGPNFQFELIALGLADLELESRRP
jgi:hypothetical protein